MTPRDRRRHAQADAALATATDLAQMSDEQLDARRIELLEAGCALQSTDDPDTDGSYARQDAEIDRELNEVKGEIIRRRTSGS